MSAMVCVCVPLATPGCTKTFSIEISRTWLTRPDDDDYDDDDDDGDGDGDGVAVSSFSS